MIAKEEMISIRKAKVQAYGTHIYCVGDKVQVYRGKENNYEFLCLGLFDIRQVNNNQLVTQ
jgi:hypothetical protein